MDLELKKELGLELATLTATLAEETRKSIDAKNVELCNTLDKKIEERLAAFQKIQAATTRRGVIPGLSPDAQEVKDFSLAKMVIGMLTKDFSDCGLELELCAAAEESYGGEMPNCLAQLTKRGPNGNRVRRDMSTVSDPAGGFIIPPQIFQSLFIERLTARSAIAQLNPTMMDGLVGAPVEIPGEASGTTAAWQGENATATQSEPTLRMIEAFPHLLGIRSVLPNRLVRMSIPSAEMIVRRILSRDMAIFSDKAAINGSGASGEPIGILQTAGIGTFDWATRKPSAYTAHDDLVDMEHTLRNADALMGNLRWLMSPDVFRSLEKRVDKGTNTNDNQPTERRILAGPYATTILGYPYVVSTNCPPLTMILGNWEDFFWMQWGTMSIKLDDLSVLGKFQIQLLAGVEMDFQVTHGESFCNGLNITV